MGVRTILGQYNGRIKGHNMWLRKWAGHVRFAFYVVHVGLDMNTRGCFSIVYLFSYH